MNQSISLAAIIGLLIVSIIHANAAPICQGEVSISKTLSFAPASQTAMLDLIDDKKSIYKLTDIYSPEFLPKKLLRQRSALLEQFIQNEHGFYRNKTGFSDRYKRQNYHIFSKNPTNWLQGKLISAGLAYVAPNSQALSCIDHLLIMEKTARIAKLGLWAMPEAQIIRVNAKTLLRQKSKYKLIKGTILTTGQTKTMIYLNFGGLWKEDFTVKIPKQIFKTFDFGEKPTGQKSTKYLEGKTVIIRGWLLEDGGPLIELSHSKQLQIEF